MGINARAPILSGHSRSNENCCIRETPTSPLRRVRVPTIPGHPSAAVFDHSQRKIHRLMKVHTEQTRLLNSTVRKADAAVVKFHLSPDGSAHVRRLVRAAKDEFGVTLSVKINGHISNHRDFVRRRVNVDCGLSRSETKFPNIHCSQRHKWPHSMLSKARCISLPKAHL